MAKDKPMTQTERVDTVVRAGRLFQCVIDIGKDLERIGNIEQTEKEAQARLEKVQSELETVTGNVSALTAQLSELNKEISEKNAIREGWAKEIDVHEDKIASLLARQDGVIMRSGTAEKDAEAKVAAAKSRADKILADANKVKAETAAVLRAAKVEVEEQKAELAKGAQELAEIGARLAAAKDHVKTVFSGFGTEI